MLLPTSSTSPRSSIRTDNISSYISYEDRAGSSSVSPIRDQQAGYPPTMLPILQAYSLAMSPISSPQAGYLPPMSPISSPQAEYSPTMSPISSGPQTGYSPTISPISAPPQAGHSPTMSRNYYDWPMRDLPPIDPDFTYDTLGHLERARTRSRSNMGYSNSFDNSGTMGGGNNQNYGGVGSSSPRRPRRPQYEGNQPVQEQKHPLKRVCRWLWILLVFVCCIVAWIVWTSGCICFINISYIIWGMCENCANRSQGGCHDDCPVICEGIERSLAWSCWGGRHLIRFAKWLLTSRERWEVIRGRLSTIVTPPDQLYPNPANNRHFRTVARALDNVMEDLTAFADRVRSGTQSLVFFTLDAMVDLSAS